MALALMVLAAHQRRAYNNLAAIEVNLHLRRTPQRWPTRPRGYGAARQTAAPPGTVSAPLPRCWAVKQKRSEELPHLAKPLRGQGYQRGR